jgi:hypothetical protein
MTAPATPAKQFAFHHSKDVRIHLSRAAADTVLAEADGKMV